MTLKISAMNRRWLLSLCARAFVIGLLFHTPLFAHDSDQTIRMSRSGVEGSHYSRYRGVVRIRTSVGALKDLMFDSASYTRWLYGCVHARVLKGDLKSGRAYLYLIYASPELPWYLFYVPRSEYRDMVLRLEWKEDKTSGRVVIALENADPDREPDLWSVQIPADSSLVTARKVSVLWELIPESNNQVTVIHEMYIDPDHDGNDLGIMNRYVKTLVEKTLQNVQARMSREDHSLPD